MCPVLTKGCGNQMHHQDQHTFQQATAMSLFTGNNIFIVYGEPYTIMEKVQTVNTNIQMKLSNEHEN